MRTKYNLWKFPTTLVYDSSWVLVGIEYVALERQYFRVVMQSAILGEKNYTIFQSGNLR